MYPRGVKKRDSARTMSVVSNYEFDELRHMRVIKEVLRVSLKIPEYFLIPLNTQAQASSVNNGLQEQYFQTQTDGCQNHAIENSKTLLRTLHHT